MASTDRKQSPAVPTPKRTFVLASRTSELAQIQTNIVRDALEHAHPDLAFGTSFMRTEGDKNSQALYLLGGKALWTKELEVALREGVVDMLVHSLKDVPTTLPEGCEIAAILKRESAADSLVVKRGTPWTSLDDLPDGSVVGTSSVRRVSQLRKAYPQLVFLDVRGNLNTRMKKLDDPDGPYAALILANAGLARLGMGDRITHNFTAPTLYHAVSQGALGVEIRSDDAESRALCASLMHWETQWGCLAERACLRVLEGGCSVPVGVESVLEHRGQAGEKRALLRLAGCVTAIDGQTQVEHVVSVEVASVEEAEEVGVQLARTLLSTGAKAILDDITKDRDRRVGEAKSADEVANIETMMEGTAARN
ncbi:hypothetical protein PLICRDRAFT_43922 [Plicaturopsis crispa FD-325 SS-3]|nr:hypothetical protein PLICRDRAFT_43922 [Plicaturopsis crispa FD-325 SS-3]